MAEAPDVPWRDLAVVGPADALRELVRPAPWIALAVAFAVGGNAIGATVGLVVSTGIVFLLGVRLNHDAIHRTLGLSDRGSDLVMAAVSVVLGGATHALMHSHRIHHRRCLAEDDLEGRAAAHGFWQALWRSPLYPLQIHAAALRDGDARVRRWVVGELGAVALVQLAAWVLLDVPALRTVSVTLLAANAAVPMVGIWAVHHGCHGGAHVARTSRSRTLDWLVASMFLHDEHHRYPRVPTRHLRELARRIDAAGGVSTARRVVASPSFGRARPVDASAPQRISRSTYAA